MKMYSLNKRYTKVQTMICQIQTSQSDNGFNFNLIDAFNLKMEIPQPRLMQERSMTMQLDDAFVGCAFLDLPDDAYLDGDIVEMDPKLEDQIREEFHEKIEELFRNEFKKLLPWLHFNKFSFDKFNLTRMSFQELLSKKEAVTTSQRLMSMSKDERKQYRQRKQYRDKQQIEGEMQEKAKKFQIKAENKFNAIIRHAKKEIMGKWECQFKSQSQGMQMMRIWNLKKFLNKEEKIALSSSSLKDKFLNNVFKFWDPLQQRAKELNQLKKVFRKNQQSQIYDLLKSKDLKRLQTNQNRLHKQRSDQLQKLKNGEIELKVDLKEVILKVGQEVDAEYDGQWHGATILGNSDMFDFTNKSYEEAEGTDRPTWNRIKMLQGKKTGWNQIIEELNKYKLQLREQLKTQKVEKMDGQKQKVQKLFNYKSIQLQWNDGTFSSRMSRNEIRLSDQTVKDLKKKYFMEEFSKMENDEIWKMEEDGLWEVELDRDDEEKLMFEKESSLRNEFHSNAFCGVINEEGLKKTMQWYLSQQKKQKFKQLDEEIRSFIFEMTNLVGKAKEKTLKAFYQKHEWEHRAKIVYKLDAERKMNEEEIQIKKQFLLDPFQNRLSKFDFCVNHDQEILDFWSKIDLEKLGVSEKFQKQLEEVKEKQ